MSTTSQPEPVPSHPTEPTCPEDLPDVVFLKSPLAVLPSIAAWLVLSVISAYLSFVFPVTIQQVNLLNGLGLSLSFPLPLLALAPLVYGFWIFHNLYDQRYVIGCDHVRCIQGLLSFSKHDFRVDFQDIRGVEIDRSLYGRLVNIGTLAIGSASRSDIEVHLVGIYNPSRYRDIIASRRKFYSQELMKGPKDLTVSAAIEGEQVT